MVAKDSDAANPGIPRACSATIRMNESLTVIARDFAISLMISAIAFRGSASSSFVAAPLTERAGSTSRLSNGQQLAMRRKSRACSVRRCLKRTSNSVFVPASSMMMIGGQLANIAAAASVVSSEKRNLADVLSAKTCNSSDFPEPG